MYYQSTFSVHFGLKKHDLINRNNEGFCFVIVTEINKEKTKQNQNKTKNKKDWRKNKTYGKIIKVINDLV